MSFFAIVYKKKVMYDIQQILDSNHHLDENVPFNGRSLCTVI